MLKWNLVGMMPEKRRATESIEQNLAARQLNKLPTPRLNKPKKKKKHLEVAVPEYFSLSPKQV